MRYIRMLLSFFLSAFLLLALPLTAYAGTASSSDASRSDALRPPVAFGSNALRPPMDDFVESDEGDSVDPFGSFEFPVFNNTVPRANVYLTFEYYDMSNVIQRKTVFCDSNGWFNIERPADYVRPIRFVISTESIPSSGKYKYQVACYTQGGGTNSIKSYKVGFGKQYKNAETLWEYATVPGTSEWSQWYMSGIVDLGNIDTMEWSVYSDEFGFNFNGEVKIGFFKVSEDTSPDVSSPGTSSGDINNDMSNSMQEQVEQGDTIIELIKNTIQTISSQLTAFWNQLAGEFTNLYNKMNAHHSEDLAKVDEQISADRQNTDDLISNQDKNTDTMVNGYDNSGMNSDNDRLNSSLTEYGQAEDNLMGDVNKHIGSIDFDYSFDSIVNVVGSVSDFFQGIYERSGQFQIVINVCLILSLASCAVGIYRLKGGG